MPVYKVSDPSTGRIVYLTGDSPPTEMELEDIFNKVSGSLPTTNRSGQSLTGTEPTPPKKLGGFVKNIGTNAVNFVKGGVNMIRHPLQAAKGLEELAYSGIAKMADPMQYASDTQMPPEQQGANQVIKPYRSLKNFSNYAYENPINAAMDVSMVAGGLGVGAKLAGLPKIATKAAKVSELVNPVSVGLKIAGKTTNILGKTISGGANTVGKIPQATAWASGKVVNSLIKPLLKDFSYGKNPGQEIARQGIVANSLDDLGVKIAKTRKSVGTKINNILSNSKYDNVKINVTDALAPLDDAMKTAASQNNQALLTRLQNTKRAITQDLTLDYDMGQPIIKTLGDRNLKALSPVEASKIKTQIGDLTAWTGNPTDDKLVNIALKQTYGKIKEKIGAVVPEVKSLNESYANLTSAEIATKYRDKITSRQNLVSLAPKVIGGGGILYGVATGNLPVVLQSIAALGVDQVLGSTMVKSRIASGIAKLSKIEQETVFKYYPWLNKALNATGESISKGGETISKFGRYSTYDPKEIKTPPPLL